MSRISLDEISLDNQKFWRSWFMCNFPAGCSEEEELTMEDMAEDIADEDDFAYWNELSGWYDGVLEESDGYIDDPNYIEVALSGGRTLKIELHPGDTIFYINGQEIGCTGPHYVLNSVLFDDVLAQLDEDDGEILFWLLLPMAYIDSKDIEKTVDILTEKLQRFFDYDISVGLAVIIVSQLCPQE